MLYVLFGVALLFAPLIGAVVLTVMGGVLMVLFSIPLFALAWRMWQGGGAGQGVIVGLKRKDRSAPGRWTAERANAGMPASPGSSARISCRRRRPISSRCGRPRRSIRTRSSASLAGPRASA